MNSNVESNVWKCGFKCRGRCGRGFGCQYRFARVLYVNDNVESDLDSNTDTDVNENVDLVVNMDMDTDVNSDISVI